MPRFEPIRNPSIDARVSGIYREIVEAGLGSEMPIHWFRVQSGRPDILETTWKLVKGLLLQGELPGTLKHMMLVRIAADHGCRYCHILHSSALEAMGVPAEVVDSATTDVNPAKLPPVQRAVVEFAAKAASSPQSVSDEDFAALRRNGLSRGEIIEATMIAALANFLDSWAEVSGIMLEHEEGSA